MGAMNTAQQQKSVPRMKATVMLDVSDDATSASGIKAAPTNQ